MWLNSRREFSKISICALKGHNGVSTASFDVIELNAKNLVPSQMGVRYVQLAPDGQLIVQLDYLPYSRMELDVLLGLCKSEEILIKLSRDKAITWQVALKAMINRPAIGKDSIYYVQEQQESPSDLAQPAFFKADLKDGSIIYEVPLPSHLIIRIAHHNTSLKLTADESLAIWTDLDNKAYVFSTATGELIYAWDRPFSKDLVVSSTKNKFWDVQLDFDNFGSVEESHVHIKSANPFMIERLCLPRAHFGESRFFDGDRLICGSLWHENPFPERYDLWPPYRFRDMDVVDPFTVINILAGPDSTSKYLEYSRLNPTRLYPYDCFADKTTITLPRRSTKERERRTLETELPWLIHDGDYFGMCEDYLVLHSRSDQTLLLVDFWPTW